MSSTTPVLMRRQRVWDLLQDDNVVHFDEETDEEVRLRAKRLHGPHCDVIILDRE